MRVNVLGANIKMKAVDAVRVSETDVVRMVEDAVSYMTNSGEREYWVGTGDVVVWVRYESSTDECPQIITVDVLRPERRAIISACCQEGIRQIV